MNASFPAAALLMAMSVSEAGAEVIRPKIASRFGELVSLEVEFVDKQKTYFQQNLIKAPLLATVLAVNGKQLAEPIVIEYQAGSGTFEKGRKYFLEGFEDLYSVGEPREWDEWGQIPYGVHHRLILRTPKPK